MNDRIWSFLKYLSFCIIAIMSVVLLVQYISLAGLNQTNDNLNTKYASNEQELNQKNDYLEQLTNNYDQYVEDYQKENGNMQNSGEQVIVPKN